MTAKNYDISEYLDGLRGDSTLLFLNDNFLLYSTDKIQDQAIPSITDGLTPSQRAYMLALSDLGANHNAKTQKSQRVNSQVNAIYRATGNPYDVLCNMTKAWQNPVPLTVGEGNWGEIEGAPVAAERYTEVKLSALAEAMFLQDLPNTTRVPTSQKPYGIVPTVMAYTDTHWCETVLPARIPFILMNSTNGIAVGIAQTWQPLEAEYALRQTLNYLNHQEIDYSTIAMGYVTKPWILTPKADLIKAYKTGRGSIRLAAKFKVDRNAKREMVGIYITNTPPAVPLNSIGDSLNKWRIDDRACPFSAFQNQTEEDDVKLYFPLKKECYTTDITSIKRYVADLYANCGLVTHETVNMVALNGTMPDQYTLEKTLDTWFSQRDIHVRNRAKYDYTRFETRILACIYNLFAKDMNSKGLSNLLSTSGSVEELTPRMLALYAEWMGEFSKTENYSKISSVVSDRVANVPHFMDYVLDLKLRQIAKLSEDSLIKQVSNNIAQYLYHLKIYSDSGARRQLIIEQVQEILDGILSKKYKASLGGCEFKDDFITNEKTSARNTAQLPMVEQIKAKMGAPIDPYVVNYSTWGFIYKVSNRAVKSTPLSLDLVPQDKVRSCFACNKAFLPALGDSGRLMFINPEDLTLNKPVAVKTLQAKYKDYPRVLITVAHEDFDSLLIASKDMSLKLVDINALGSLRKTIKLPDEPIRAAFVNRKKSLTTYSSGSAPQTFELSKLQVVSANQVSRLLKYGVLQVQADGLRAIVPAADKRGIVKL